MIKEDEASITLELTMALHETVRQMCYIQSELHRATARLYALEARLDGLQEVNHFWDGS